MKKTQNSNTIHINLRIVKWAQCDKTQSWKM